MTIPSIIGDPANTYYLFLNFGGVLYKHRSHSPRGQSPQISRPHFSKDAIACLENLAERIMQSGKEFKIIVSSNHRIGKNVAELKTYFSGTQLSPYIFSKTSERVKNCDELCNQMEAQEDEDHYCRAIEINSWLRGYPNACYYSIFDDSKTQDLKENFEDRFVWVNPDNLLQQQDVDQAFAVFERQVLQANDA